MMSAPALGSLVLEVFSLSFSSILINDPQGMANLDFRDMFVGFM